MATSLSKGEVIMEEDGGVYACAFKGCEWEGMDANALKEHQEIKHPAVDFAEYAASKPPKASDTPVRKLVSKEYVESDKAGSLKSTDLEYMEAPRMIRSGAFLCIYGDVSQEKSEEHWLQNHSKFPYPPKSARRCNHPEGSKPALAIVPLNVKQSKAAEAPQNLKSMGVRAFAQMNLRHDDDRQLLPTRGKPPIRQLSHSPVPTISSSPPPSPIPQLQVRKIKSSCKERDPNYNPELSDSDMSIAPENLRVPKRTFNAAASTDMDSDSVMRFPAETEYQYPKIITKKNKSIKCALTTYQSDSASDENFHRGRYMGKDRMKNGNIQRNTGLFVTELNKEPAMAFYSTIDTGPISFLERQRKLLREAATKMSGATAENSDDGTGDVIDPVENTATVHKRKRANCAGPVRAKRAYVWRDGGKRAGEAGVRKKLKIMNSKPKDADMENRHVEDREGHDDDVGAGGED